LQFRVHLSPLRCRLVLAETTVYEQKQVRRFSGQVVPPPSKDDDAGGDHEQAGLGRVLMPHAAQTEHHHGGGLARADATSVGVVSVGLVSNPGDDVSSPDECFCGSGGKSFSNGCLSSEV
jgi:hypothetical protein